jgi:hypothetical protein
LSEDDEVLAAGEGRLLLVLSWREASRSKLKQKRVDVIGMNGVKWKRRWAMVELGLKKDKKDESQRREGIKRSKIKGKGKEKGRKRSGRK